MTVFALNSKARFDFELLDRVNAGLELEGHEVKAIRAGKMNIIGSYVVIRGGEAFLTGAQISPYQARNVPKDYDPLRARRLLVSKQELAQLARVEATKGLTIVPLSVYNEGRFLKLDVAIARGKKKFDKRQAIKKRDIERDLKRSL